MPPRKSGHKKKSGHKRVSTNRRSILRAGRRKMCHNMKKRRQVARRIALPN